MSGTRRIWVLADPHIGHVSDGKDGAEWTQLAMHDRRDFIGPVDYAINLGDVSHAYQEDQLARWVELRDASGVGRWFEVVGNHDFHATETGLYQRIVSPHRYWTMVDGNVAFFSLPAERGNAAGLLVPEVEAWLRAAVAAHADKNVVIAAHQLPYDTVEYSTRPSRSMYPRTAVERFLADVRVDLWLGGHIHFAPRTPACSSARNGTTFINVASLSHTYNKDACISFVLELQAGRRRAVARCRDHDRHRYLDDQQVELDFRLPCEFSPDGPAFTPAALDVPVRYGKIDEEEVAGF